MFTTIELLLLTAVSILFAVQCIYYCGLYNRIYRRHVDVSKGRVEFSQELPPLSVVLYAHNAAENLRRNLPAILKQDYPRFEVIVIDDASTDETGNVLEMFEKEYPHLYHSFTPSSARYISHKKLALTLGVKASKYDWLVFTETNCTPDSDQWLRLMARNFTPQTQIVMGYSNYVRAKGWFQKKVAFDTLFQSMRYLGFALAGKPYMGVGRNLAYRKELFFKQKGYSSYLNLQRGEDDLFVNQASDKGNTRVETDSRAAVRILPVEHKKEWKEEKVSYMATSRHYRGVQRYLNGLETTSRLLFYAACIAGATEGVVNRQWIAGSACLVVWILRYIVQAVVVNRTARKLGEQQAFYFSLPVFDLTQPLQSARFKLSRILRDKGEFMRR